MSFIKVRPSGTKGWPPIRTPRAQSRGDSRTATVGPHSVAAKFPLTTKANAPSRRRNVHRSSWGAAALNA